MIIAMIMSNADNHYFFHNIRDDNSNDKGITRTLAIAITKTTMITTITAIIIMIILMIAIAIICDL